MSIRPVRFGQKAAERASDEWGCNCGPGAIAAMLGLTLDEVRPRMGDFERKGYTNPTLMFATLDRIGANWIGTALGRASRSSPVIAQLDWPKYGLARIQWEGPWSAPGMNPRWGYRHTHWVGACADARADYIEGPAIFDINCMQNGSGWVSLIDWEVMVVPWLLKNCVPRANGKWHITHAIEIAQLEAVKATRA